MVVPLLNIGTKTANFNVGDNNVDGPCIAYMECYLSIRSTEWPQNDTGTYLYKVCILG